MLFNSISYLWFLPLVFAGYFLLPKKLKNPLLLVASYYFYMSWLPQYAVLIFFSTISTYLSAYFIEKSDTEKMRKISLGVNIGLNLAILFIFKYFNFFIGSISAFFGVIGITLPEITSSLLLPVGISFYTFQALGYSIDVYRGKIAHERNFFTYALFVSFFPQLVAGPIERSTNLLPQFHEEHKFSYPDAVMGAREILFGMFKKVAIADTIAIYANNIYDTNNLRGYEGLPLILATLLFAVQIYCDFSGYSDIARGSARLLGFRLMENFKAPYFSTSISKFWDNWHISLSSWFRDYLYIPLGGNRKGERRRIINIFIVFVVSGLWHGAAFTFIIWGLIHATLRVCEELIHLKFGKPKERAGLLGGAINIGKWAVTMLFVVFAWIFFRAVSISDAFYVIGNLFSSFDLGALKNTIVDAMYPMAGVFAVQFGYIFIGVVGISVSVLFAAEFISLRRVRGNIAPLFDAIPKWARYTCYYIMAILVIACYLIQYGGFGMIGEFIYFDF